MITEAAELSLVDPVVRVAAGTGRAPDATNHQPVKRIPSVVSYIAITLSTPDAGKDVWGERVEVQFDLEQATDGRYTYLRDIDEPVEQRQVFRVREVFDLQARAKRLRHRAVDENRSGAGRHLSDKEVGP